MAVFPSAVPTNNNLYIAINTGVTSLTANINNSTLTIPVTSTTGFPSVGFVTIDGEIIRYTSIGPTQFNADLRGADGTAANSHLSGAQVNHFIIAAHHNVHNDEIIAIAQNLSDRIGLGATQLKAQDGTANLPTYSFASQTSMGFRRVSANKIAYSAGTVDMVTIDTTALDLTNNAALFMSSGAAANPILAHRGNTDSGLYWPTTNSMAFSFEANTHVTVRGDNSVDRGILINLGFLKFGQDGTVAQPILSWESDIDTGIFHPATNRLGLVASGVEALRISNDGFQTLDGTAGSPSMTFLSDADTGFYHPNPNEISVTTGGIERVRFKNAALEMRSGVIENTNGTVSLPAYSFSNDTDSGLYLFGANSIGFTIGGIHRGEFNQGYFLLSPVGGATSSMGVYGDNAGFDNVLIARNNNATSGGASVQAFATNTTGDATFFATNQIVEWIWGLDNSDGDSWALCRSSVLGTNTAIRIDTSNRIQAGVDGTAGAPVWSFVNDGNTGMYRPSGDQIGFATNGTLRWTIDSDGDLTAQNGSIIRNADGSLAFPSFGFENDPDTGIFRPGANQMDLVTGGTLALRVETPTNGVSIIGVTSGVNAAAGFVGEYVQAVTGNVPSPGTNQWFDMTSISLTAGDWDVYLVAANNSTNYSACTDIEFGLGTLSGNNSPGATQMLDFISMSWAGGHLGKINQTMHKRFLITSTTTVYAKALMTFTSGTQNGLCKIWARRRR